MILPAAVEDDPRDVRERLDVVDVRGSLRVALLRRERRLQARHAAVAFERLDEGRLLAAHERARARLDADVAGEAAAEDVLAEEAGLLRGRERLLETHDRERVLGAHVNKSFSRADRVGGDEHALDEGVRIALDHRAVHERAGVALVRVADEVLLVALRVARGVPLEPGGEARAAASGEAGDLDLLDHLLRRHREDLADRLVAIHRLVGRDVLGVDEAAVPQRDTRLLLQELLVVRRNLQVGQLRKGRTILVLYACCPRNRLVDPLRVLFLHLHEALHECAAVVDVDDRLQIAHADAAGDADFDGPLRVQFLHGRADLARAGGDAAASLSENELHFDASRILRTISFALAGVREP